MNERQLEYFRRKLFTWKADLMGDSKNTIEGLQDSARAVPDIADRASEETDRALELRTRGGGARKGQLVRFAKLLQDLLDRSHDQHCRRFVPFPAGQESNRTKRRDGKCYMFYFSVFTFLRA